MAAEALVILERHGAVAHLQLNNPPLNLVSVALTKALDQQLTDLTAEAEAAVPTVRAIVLSGGNARGFCGGSDIKEFGAYHRRETDVRSAKLDPENEMYRKLASFPLPTIAAVHGNALGGGLELALACDLIVVEEDAVLALPEVGLGVFPGSGGTFRLTRRVGLARARELIFLGDRFSAAEALDWGMINRVAARGRALATALELAARVAARSPHALRQAKRAVAEVYAPDEAALIAGLLPKIEAAFHAPDIAEGVRAFLAKEPAEF